MDKQKFHEIREKNDRQLLEMSLTTSLADSVKEEDDNDKGKKKKMKGKRKKSAKDDSIPVKPPPDRYAELEPRYCFVIILLCIQIAVVYQIHRFKAHSGNF